MHRAEFRQKTAGISQHAQNPGNRVPSAEGGEPDVLVALGEPASLSVCHEGNMRIYGNRMSKGFVETDLTGCGRENIPAAHHFCNTGESIIHHHGQLIPKETVAAPQHKIAAVPCGIFSVLSLYKIMEGDGPVRHAETDGRVAQGGQGLDFRGAQMGAGTWIDILRIPEIGGRQGVQHGSGAEAGISETEIRKPLQVLFINLRALRLVENGTVPVKPEQAEILDALLRVFRRASGQVQVLNAQ